MRTWSSREDDIRAKIKFARTCCPNLRVLYIGGCVVNLLRLSFRAQVKSVRTLSRYIASILKYIVCFTYLLYVLTPNRGIPHLGLVTLVQEIPNPTGPTSGIRAFALSLRSWTCFERYLVSWSSFYVRFLVLFGFLWSFGKLVIKTLILLICGCFLEVWKIVTRWKCSFIVSEDLLGESFDKNLQESFLHWF